MLGANEQPPRHVPVVVRDLVGRARATREICRAVPDAHQPFRASAGLVAETGGAWAFWEEASGEVQEATVRTRADRRVLLRELALTVSHELGNALVSLATLRFSTPEQPLPLAILEAAKSDVVKLEALNNQFALMQTLHEAEPAPVDILELLHHLGASMGFRVELNSAAVTLTASRSLLEAALRAIIASVAENRPGLGMTELSLRVRVTGQGDALTALLSIRGKILQLEGILPEPAENAVPNQGRFGVFLAKEIIRLHRGTLLAGPGLEGTEILLSLRSL